MARAGTDSIVTISPNASSATASTAISAASRPSCAQAPEASASGVLPSRRRARRSASAQVTESTANAGSASAKRGETRKAAPKSENTGATARTPATHAASASVKVTSASVRRCRASASGRSGVLDASCTRSAESPESAIANATSR